MIDQLLSNNMAWASARIRADPQFFRRLSAQQAPEYLWIGCSDSRVPANEIVGLDPGELFVHRNIANLVPPHNPDGEHHGTSAALEYGVLALKVAHLVVMGHSGCGGVRGCHDMCSAHAPELEAKSSYVGRWMDILRPGYERVKEVADEAARIAALEQQDAIGGLAGPAGPARLLIGDVK